MPMTPSPRAPNISQNLIFSGPTAASREASAPFRNDVIFVLALALIGGLTAFTGIAAPLGNFAHDTLFLLDNANRITQGQIPHRDFSSAWGPVMYLIDAAGLLLARLRPAGIGYANALFGSLIAIWTFLIVRARWSSSLACCLGIYTFLLIAAPFPLSNNPMDFGYAMTYNRYGYALLGLIIIECAAAAPPDRARPVSVAALSSGTAIALLAFLKISYAMVAMPFLIVSMFGIGSDCRRRLLGLCASCAAISLIIMSYLRFDFTDMLRDLAMAATARKMSLYLPRGISLSDFLQSGFLLLFSFKLVRYTTLPFHERVGQYRTLLLMLLSIAAGYLLLTTNQQTDTFPLNGYAAVTLAAALRPLAAGKARKWPGISPNTSKWLLLAACMLPLSTLNAVSIAGAAMEQLRPTIPHVTPLDSPVHGAELLFRPVMDSVKVEIMGASYVEAINDGMDLIRRHSSDRDGILAIDEFNPFNYLLGRPSPRGGFAAAAYNYIFCDAAHPTPERFFGDAPFVIVRKYDEASIGSERKNVLALMRIYGQALRQNFSMVEETGHWTLWRRK